MDTNACVIGSSQAMRELRDDAELAAQLRVSVLISGEPGAGKKMLARRIHQRSARAAARLFVLDCARVQSAAELHAGFCQAAYGGTLVLDRVSDMAPLVQQELLTLLDTPDATHPFGQLADVRLIACTHPNLAQRVDAQEFVEGLYYRLNTMYLYVPPLRERREDIPALVRYFVRRRAAETGRDVTDVSRAAMQRFVSHDWPGNLSEIRRVVEALTSADVPRSIIEADSLPADLASIGSMARDIAPAVAAQVAVPSASSAHLAGSSRPLSISVIEVNSGGESLLEFASETNPALRSVPLANVASVDESSVGAHTLPSADRESSRLRYALRRARTSMVALSTASAVAVDRVRIGVKAAAIALHLVLALPKRTWLLAAATLSQRIRLFKEKRLEQSFDRLPTFDGVRWLSVLRSLALFAWGVVTGGVVTLMATGMSIPGATIPEERHEPPSSSAAVLAEGVTGTDGSAIARAVTEVQVQVDDPAPVRVAQSRRRAPSLPSSPPLRMAQLRRGSPSFRGSLAVTSSPSGAQVRLNGRRAGRTPLVLKNLPVGSRAVRLELDRYKPWSSTIQVTTNRRTYVMADLRLAASR